jgi:ferredoxin-NADP reductase
MSLSARILTNAQIAPGLHRLSLEAPDGFSFKAGQFIILPVPTPPGAEAPAKPLKGFYSIASAPALLPRLELLVEHREGGGPVSAWASALAPGQAVAFEGPLGHFGLVEPGLGASVFVGRRAGLAPLRSLCLQALAQGGQAWLILGGDAEADWLLHAEWSALAATEPRFHYHALLGGGPELAAQALALAPPDATFYLAGFTREVAPAAEALQAAGVEAARMKVEKFG